MDPADIRPVVDTWAEQTLDLGCARIYRLRADLREPGRDDGLLQPASARPDLVHRSACRARSTRRSITQRDYFNAHGVTLLADYLAEEQRRGERIVYANEHWTVLVPFWAIWPFETLLVSNRPARSIPDLNDAERDALADAISPPDRALRQPVPHARSPTAWASTSSRPTARDYPYWHLHAHFYPPLLRSATIKKFMVGYEMLATPQRDITAEQAAARLRELSRCALYESEIIDDTWRNLVLKTFQ